MHIRCPHCSHPVEVVAEVAWNKLSCPACGSSFNLLGTETVLTESFTAATFGRFAAISVLGTGAFGTVWKAQDRELDRVVAIKVPRREQVEPKNTELFLREARAAAQLRHPNIVAVHEVGHHGDTLYIVSDFVDGVTLGDWLTAHRLTSREAAELCATIAAALHYAHETGVIHRDIKPSNIMLDAAHKPYVMDFGLAKREAGEITMTVAGKILGTPAYMSPEQARGEAHQADRRSDVYSLGAVLFELLTGEKPFRGDVHMLLHQVIHDDPPNPRKLNGTIPRDLENITLKCLDKEPRKRYQSANELAQDLQRYLDGKPVLARPLRRRARLWRWVCRNPKLAVATGSAVAALLATTAMATIASLFFLGKSVFFDLGLSELVRSKSSDVFGTVDHMVARADPNKAPPDTSIESLHEQLVGDTLAFYHKYQQKKGSGSINPKMTTLIAAQHEGQILMSLGRLDDAEKVYRQAATIGATIHKDNLRGRPKSQLLFHGPPNPVLTIRPAVVCREYGKLLSRFGRNMDAEKFLQRGIAMAGALAARWPQVPAFRLELAKGNDELGDLLTQMKRTPEADQAYRKAIERRKESGTSAEPWVSGERRSP